MHDHFEEGDGGDADVFEVIGIIFPGAFVGYGFLFFFIVAVEGVAVGVYELDCVFQLCCQSA